MKEVFSPNFAYLERVGHTLLHVRTFHTKFSPAKVSSCSFFNFWHKSVLHNVLLFAAVRVVSRERRGRRGRRERRERRERCLWPSSLNRYGTVDISDTTDLMELQWMTLTNCSPNTYV